MAFEDNTTDNGDESSNRQFVIIAASLGAVFIIGLIVLVLVLTSRQGARQEVANGNGTAAALQTTQAQVAQVTDTLEPTATEAPTDTPEPSPTRPLPTQTFTPEPTQLSADVSPGASAAAGTTTAGTTTAAQPGATGTSVALSGTTAAVTGTRPAATTARPAGTTARSTATGTGSTGNSSDLPNTGVGEVAGLMFAGFLVLLIVAARRMRVSQS